MFILGRFPKVLLVLLSGLPYKESMVMVFARYRRWHLKLLEGKNDFLCLLSLLQITLLHLVLSSLFILQKVLVVLRHRLVRMIFSCGL